MPVIAASWKPRSPNSAAAASISRRRVLRPRSVRGSLSPLALAALPKVAIGPPAREVEPVFSFAQAGVVAVDPLPFFTGEEGPAAKRWEVRVLLTQCYRPSPPKLRLGPSSPAKSGRGNVWLRPALKP